MPRASCPMASATQSTVEIGRVDTTTSKLRHNFVRRQNIRRGSTAAAGCGGARPRDVIGTLGRMDLGAHVERARSGSRMSKNGRLDPKRRAGMQPGANRPLTLLICEGAVPLRQSLTGRRLTTACHYNITLPARLICRIVWESIEDYCFGW